MPNITQIEAYVQQLAHHDWHYQKTKDLDVFLRGENEHIALRAMAKQDSVFEQAYEAFAYCELQCSTKHGVQICALKRDNAIEAIERYVMTNDRCMALAQGD